MMGRHQAAATGRVRRALARRAGIRFFRFFSRDLAKRAAPNPPPGITLQQLSQADLLDLSGEGQLDLRPEAIRQAYARGDQCVGAVERGALAGYCWHASAPLPHLDGVWVRFRPSSGWVYKSFVRPTHRGRGIGAALYDAVGSLGAGRGLRGSLVCMESHNLPSIRAAIRAGYRPAGYGAYLVRAMPFATWCSPAAREHGVAFILPPRAQAG